MWAFVCALQRSAVLIIMVIHNDPSFCLMHTHHRRSMFLRVCVYSYRSSVTFPVGRSLMWFFSSTQLSAEVNLCHPNTHRHTRECAFSASVAEWVNLQSLLMLCDIEGWLQRQDTLRQQRPHKTHTHKHKPYWFTAFPPMACPTSSFSKLSLSHTQVSVVTHNLCQRQVHGLCWPSQVWVLSKRDSEKQGKK